MTTRQELEQRLAEAEATLDALRRQEVDAVVGADSVMVVRLRETERALRESEQRLRLAMRASRMATFIWDIPTGRIERTEAGPLAGPPVIKHESQGWDAIHPEDLPDVRAALEQAIAQRREFAADFRFIHPETNEETWLHCRGIFEFDQQDQPLRMVGTSTDITPRKQAELALRESENRYRHLVEQVEDYAIFGIGLDGTALTWNEGVRRVLGFEEHEFIGCDVTETIFTPEDIAAGVPQQELEEAALAGTASNDRPMRRKNGERFSAQGVTTGIRDTQGRLVGFTKIMRDHTRLKQAEDELRRSELIFRRLAESNLFGVGFGDSAGNVAYVNDEMLRMMGATRADYEAGRLNFADRLAPEYRDEIAAFAEILQREGSVTGYERAFLRPDGSRVPFLGAAANVTPDEDLHLSIALDLTRIRAAEAALRESEERLRLARDAAGLGIHDYNVVTGEINWDQRVRELWGFSPDEEVTFEKFMAGIHPDDRPEVQAALDRSLDPDRHGVYYAEYRVIRRGTNVVRWVAATGRVSFADRRPLRLVGTVQDITHEKMAEVALRESEQRFRNLADTAPATLWVADPAGQCTFLSRSWYEYTGLPEGSAVGFGWLDALHPDDRPDAERIFLEANARREPVSIDYRLRRADGEYRWATDMGRPRFADDGEFLGYVGSVVEIHERKMAEEAVRERESFYRQTLDSIPGMTFTNLPDGTCDFVSEQWAQYTGVPAEQQYGDGWIKLLHPDDRERAVAAWQSAVEGSSLYDLEYRVRRKDGAYEWFKVRGRPIRDARSRIARWIGTAINVEGLKRTEQALRESERRLHAAQQAGGIGTFFWDMLAGSVNWSPELEALYGLEPGGFGGTYEAWTALVHADDLPKAEERVRLALEKGDFEAEWRVKLPDGRVRWLEARGWVEHDPAGKPVNMLGVNVDVTARKRYEQQIRAAMSELNHRVKNTLATIDAVANQTLDRATTLDNFRESFKTRLQSMASAHSLLTRSEWSGVEFHEILRSELLNRVSSPDHLQLDGPRVMIEPEATLSLHMAMHELATNAAKYGSLSVPDGRLSVSWVVSGDAPNEEMEIDWKELGGPRPSAAPEPGFGTKMISENIEYALDGSVERNFEPDGLRCRIILPLGNFGHVLDGVDQWLEDQVRLHRPQSWGSRPDGPAEPARRAARRPSSAVESSPSSGPASSPAAGSPAGEQPSPPASAPPVAANRRGTVLRTAAQSLRVLVVEDNLAIAQSLCTHLESAGHTVVGPVPTLDRATRLAAESEFDAALLDVNLRGTMVYPLARALKERSAPFAMLTGFNAEDLPDDLADAAVFNKPIDPAVLHNWLSHL